MPQIIVGWSEGFAMPKKAYEISKSYDFKLDFGTSSKISRFQWDFNEISGFQVGFQDFDCDFWISNCVVDTAKFAIDVRVASWESHAPQLIEGVAYT